MLLFKSKYVICLAGYAAYKFSLKSLCGSCEKRGNPVGPSPECYLFGSSIEMPLILTSYSQTFLVGFKLVSNQTAMDMGKGDKGFIYLTVC